MKKLLLIISPSILVLICLSLAFSAQPPHEYHYLEEMVIKEPTCTVDGVKKEYCTECDYSIEKAIPASHSFSYEQTLKESTCTTNGEAIYKCDVCGAKRNETITAYHSYSGRTCTKCGHKKPLPELSVGMTKQQVETKWGKPIEIDKSTSSRGTEETWWYKENGKAIAVNFDVSGKIWHIYQ